MDNFIKIENIILETNKDGTIKESYPEKRYTGIRKRLFNGPFCSFKINNKYKDKGVYYFKVEDTIKYIGKCKNLYKRIYSHGHIAPAACYEKGQPTNCRINKLILEEVKRNDKIELYFLKTFNNNIIKKKLINKYNPEWNKKNV